MKVVRTLSICTFLLSLVAPADAHNPDRDIHQLAHRSWGEKDGILAGRRLWHKPRMDFCG